MVDFTSPASSGLYLPKDAEVEARTDAKAKATTAINLIVELQEAHGEPFGDAVCAALLTHFLAVLP